MTAGERWASEQLDVLRGDEAFEVPGRRRLRELEHALDHNVRRVI